MKRFLTVLLTITMLVSLAACSNTAPTGQDATEATPVASGESSSDASAAEKEPVTITYMRHEANDYTVEEQMIKRFQEEYPRITVEVLSIPSNDTYQKMLLADQAGEPIDVMWSFFTAGAASNGLIADLTPYMTEEYTSLFNENALKRGQFDGVQYAIPWRTGCSMMFVNLDVLEKINLNLDDMRNGWTWDEFKQYVAAMRDKDNGVYGFGMAGSSSDAGTDYGFWPWLLLAGGNVLSDDGHTAVFNSDEGAKAVQFMCDLIAEDLVPPGIGSTSNSVLSEMCGAGTLGMWANGPWTFRTLEKTYPDARLAMVPMPTFDGHQRNIVGGTEFAMSSHSKHPEEAWLFLSYMTNEENLLEFCKGYNELSPIEANWNDPFYQTDDWQCCIKALREAEYIFPSNSYYDNATLNGIMREYLSAAYLGEMAPREALDAAAGEWNVILDEYYK